MDTKELNQLKDKALRLVSGAQAAGSLPPEEAAWKKEAVLAASDFEEIDRQVSDLLAGPEVQTPVPLRSGGSRILPARAASALCIMGDRKLHGSALGDQTATVTVMGSLVVDLGDMIIDRPVILEGITVMGESIILLPPGTPVDVRMVPVMASITEDRNLVHAHEGPRVIFKGSVVMGEVRISYR